MSDTERINALEKLMWDARTGCGLAIMPWMERTSGRKLVTIIDLGDEHLRRVC